jgi:hypothetical protein
MKFSRADEIKVKELAEEYGIDVNIIKQMVSAPYDFIQSKTRELNFKDNLTREEFDSVKKNFNIPGIGKLYASYFLYEQIQKKKKKKLGS